MRLFILKRELIIQLARNNPIPYTLPLLSCRRFGQSVFHYIFIENLENKKKKN